MEPRNIDQALGADVLDGDGRQHQRPRQRERNRGRDHQLTKRRTNRSEAPFRKESVGSTSPQGVGRKNRGRGGLLVVGIVMLSARAA